MKKALSLLLTLALLLACLAPALAAQNVYLAEMGAEIPISLDDLNGFTQVYSDRVISRNPYIAAIEYQYWPIPKDAIGNEISEEVRADLMRLGGSAFILFVSDTTAEEVLQLLKLTDQVSAADVVELGKKDAYTWYGLFLRQSMDTYIAAYEAASQEDPERYPAASVELWKKDSEYLAATLPEELKQIAFDTPVDRLTAAVGAVLSFESTDLDGNPFTSEELFARNKITMVNLWGVWCPNCMVEMADLAQIHTRFQEKGCGIVGIEWERKPMEEMADEARRVLSESQITYPNVIYPADNDFLNRTVMAYPTSIFVDKNGVVLTRPIEGARVSEYEEVLEELLAAYDAEETAAEAPAEAAEETAAEAPAEAAGETAAEVKTYRITTVDASGAPVQGAMVQFCSDTLCTLGITGEDGVATFDFPAGGAYSIHILKAPEGYAADAEDYPIPADALELTITLQKAE